MESIPHNSFSSRATSAIRRAKSHLTGGNTDNEQAEARAGIVDNEAGEGVNSPGMQQVATTPSASKESPQSAADVYSTKKKGKV